MIDPISEGPDQVTQVAMTTIDSHPQQPPSLLSAIVESSDDAIMAESLEGRITFWNEGARLLFGHTRDEALGRMMSTLVPASRAVEEQSLLRKAKLGERTDHFTTVRLRSDGSRVDVSLNVSPIRDSAERVIGVSSIARDMTAQKRAEQDLRRFASQLSRANEAAEASNRTKSEFLANMTHEIRTPMTAILGFADVLLGEEGLENAPPDRVVAFETIKRNGEYLLELINDILDLSKIEAGKLDVEKATCSPARMLADVASLMRVRAVAKGLRLTVEFVGGIPETILSDPTRLRQILINLVGNAIKFTEVGSVRVVTRFVEHEDARTQLQFEVIDTGIGIAEEDISKLFQPFTQADSSTTRNFGGTGLGLSISKRLAEMLGGNIKVKSTPGAGSTFIATIETESVDSVKMLYDLTEVTVPRKNRLETGMDANVKLNCRTLLAEDGPDNQRLLSFILRKAGARVTLAENGLIARDKALAASDAGEPFDVVLMDMQMPVMDGYTATRQLRDSCYQGPIIALTADAMVGAADRCFKAGCDDYATKPIDRPKLLALISQHANK